MRLRVRPRIRGQPATAARHQPPSHDHHRAAADDAGAAARSRAASCSTAASREKAAAEACAETGPSGDTAGAGLPPYDARGTSGCAATAGARLPPCDARRSSGFPAPRTPEAGRAQAARAGGGSREADAGTRRAPALAAGRPSCPAPARYAGNGRTDTEKAKPLVPDDGRAPDRDPPSRPRFHRVRGSRDSPRTTRAGCCADRRRRPRPNIPPRAGCSERGTDQRLRCIRVGAVAEAGAGSGARSPGPSHDRPPRRAPRRSSNSRSSGNASIRFLSSKCSVEAIRPTDDVLNVATRRSLRGSDARPERAGRRG